MYEITTRSPRDHHTCEAAEQPRRRREFLLAAGELGVVTDHVHARREVRLRGTWASSSSRARLFGLFVGEFFGDLYRDDEISHHLFVVLERLADLLAAPPHELDSVVGADGDE